MVIFMTEYTLDLSRLPSVLLAGHSVCPDGWSLTGRVLDETEVIVVYEGVLHCNVGENSYYLKEGEACLVPPGEPVDQYADSGPCRFFYAHLDSPIRPAASGVRGQIVSNYLNRPATPAAFYFLPPVSPGDALLCLGGQMDTGRYKNEIFTLFQRLLLERNRQTIHSSLMISLELSQILVLLGQCWIQQAAVLPPVLERREQNRLVQDALLYLNSNFASPIRISELAVRLQVSQQYLARLFKAEVGMSPIRYLNRLRIEKAKEFMRTNAVNISEAALAVGFDNIYYFSRLFKQLEGMSPSAYRAWLNSKSNQ